MLKPLGILFIMDLYVFLFTELLYQLKLLVVDRDVIVFERSAEKCLHVIKSLRSAKKLCVNFKEPPLPSKILGHVPERKQ